MNFPNLACVGWGKSLPRLGITLAGRGIGACPPKLLGLKASDLVTALPVRYGYEPLRKAIAARYRVHRRQVFPLSGGTSFANWVACAAALDGCGSGTEVIVERPTYEPALPVPPAPRPRVRRPDRTFRN